MRKAFLFGTAVFIFGCGSSKGPYTLRHISGPTVSRIEWKSKEQIGIELRKKIKDEQDLEIEESLVPAGGMLKVKNSKYYSPSSIIRVCVENKFEKEICDDAELSQIRTEIKGVNQFGPGIPFQKVKTTMECKLSKKMTLPITLKFITVSDDTISVYEISENK